MSSRRGLIRDRGRGTAGLVEEPPRFYPELEPSYEVKLSASAGRVIREEIRRAGPYLETGGWLFCDPRDPDTVSVATGPGEGIQRRAHVELGSEDIALVKELAPHLALVGDWHVHPSADTLPSETDRRAWSRGCDLTGSHWLGVIFAPARNMWGAA
jgi:proteasome lid subunit RPN8/RPN11